MCSKIILYFNIIFAIMLFVSCQDANDDVLLLDNATDNQSILDNEFGSSEISRDAVVV
jgi:hypothetical protein